LFQFNPVALSADGVGAERRFRSMIFHTALQAEGLSRAGTEMYLKNTIFLRGLAQRC
jgi:hypothetical protein